VCLAVERWTEYQSGAPLASDRSLPPFFSLEKKLPRLHLVVSEGVYKIRDLLTMFAPTRACAGPSHMCIWSPINALYPSEGTPFGDDDLRPPRSSEDILFSGIFTSRYITHRRGWRYAWGPDRGERDRAARYATSCKLSRSAHARWMRIFNDTRFNFISCKTPGTIVIFWRLCMR